MQIAHVAASMYATLAHILGEKNPVGEPSPRDRKEVLKLMKGAFAYAHRAMRSMDEKKSNEDRISFAITTVSHLYDHYGQMVVFAQMNFVIPPASRGQ